MAQSQSASQSFFSHMDGEPYEKEEETFSERAMRGLSVRLVQTPIPKGIDVERDKTTGGSKRDHIPVLQCTVIP